MSGLKLPRLAGEIEFCNVHFAYPTRRKLLFEGLSFSIPAGKSLAIVDMSGSGKSTIISLLQQFYDPYTGNILLDGYDLRDFQLKWLREQMGLVNQESALFATSIVENILYGKDSADMEQVIEAAKAANAHSFIQSLPDGCNTQVGEGGTQLSGGQKQRAAIARALLRNPETLLLDEATSALDAESELGVQKALSEIITIRDVDQIIVLNNGGVVECGAHSELITKDGEYATFIKLQISSDNSENGIGKTLEVMRTSESSTTIQSP
ncbi:hypothetical protein Cgig2_034108 [Carnegiea gigantea]|uniref:ABC transporter domain-containing protein n=1 Tax=Carnegiea gigantea TaxID=171969 RepID=A0A9Q1QB13_9CARY|nr:hypothetical protein Cgig2_034108 [Carnegiea gigantea]